MNYGMVLAATAVMALVTYLPRMLPMAVIKRKIQNRFIRSFLTYVPYAVLAAMTFPAILMSTRSGLSASWKWCGRARARRWFCRAGRASWRRCFSFRWGRL